MLSSELRLDHALELLASDRSTAPLPALARDVCGLLSSSPVLALVTAAPSPAAGAARCELGALPSISRRLSVCSIVNEASSVVDAAVASSSAPPSVTTVAGPCTTATLAVPSLPPSSSLSESFESLESLDAVVLA